MHIDQIELQPKAEPKPPYKSHMAGPKTQVSKYKLIPIIGVFVIIIPKSDSAKLMTSRLAGVRSDFVVENI